MTAIGKSIALSLVAAGALALTAGVAFAEHHFAGTWKVKDGSGSDFEITLNGNGSASANRGPEGMHGKWAEKNGAAVISWDTGWTTKIAKHGKQYEKTAFEGDKEKSTSSAVKVK